MVQPTVAAAPTAVDRRNTAALVGFTAVANLADGVLKVALPLLATRLTRSPAQITGVALTLTLPWLLTALHVGVLVDRYDRRRLLVAANAARVVAIAGLLAAVLAGLSSLPLLYAAGAVLGVAEVVALTAATALVPVAVGPAGRDRVNARMTAAETVCNEFCGPFVGGLLVALGFTVALTGSALAFLLALLLPALLVGRFRPDAGTGRPARRLRPARGEVTEGLRYLWRTPLLRVMALTLTVLCTCWGGWLAILPLLTTEAGLGATGYGLVLSGLGLGGLTGAAAAMPLNRLIGRRWVMFGDIVGTFAMVATPLLTTSAVALGGSAFLGGLGGTLWSVNARTLSQHLVPTALMGRFHAAWRLLSWGALPLGAFAIGQLGEAVGTRAAFGPFALATAALLVPFLRVVTGPAVAAAERASAADPVPTTTGQAERTTMPVTPTEPAGEGTRPARLAAALRRAAPGDAPAGAELIALGLDSLALVRLVIEVVGDDPDLEIDLGRIGELRTVGDLQDWLTGAVGDRPQVVR